MSAVELLFVDDSSADRASFRIAFERSGYPMRLHFASSAKTALTMLRAQPEEDAALRPQILFIDVNMPGISGLELLKTLKSDDDLLKIPVIMFSGSDNETDIVDAYANHASGYICKPSDLDGLCDMAGVIGRLCTSVLAFPAQ